MASEYLKWKYRDVKPDEPPRPRTRKEKLANWFHYNKWWIVVWAVVLWVAGSMIWNVLGIGRVRPDYIFAYVGDYALPEDCAAALEDRLAALGQDVNGDGRVVAELRQYTSGSGADDPMNAMQAAYAADVTLVSDITVGESYFFLTEDPEALQKNYQILADEAGAMPEREDFSIEGRVYRWGDCPTLAGLDLGRYEQSVLDQTVEGDCQELLSGLYIGRRGYYDESQAKNRAENEALWDILIEGAVS